MLVALIMGTVVAFSTTPVYEAVGRIVINREGADTAGLKNADAGAGDSYDDYMVCHGHADPCSAKRCHRQTGHPEVEPGFRSRHLPARARPAASGLDRRRRKTGTSNLIVKRHWSGSFTARSRSTRFPGHACWKFASPALTRILAAKAVNTVIDTYIEQNYKTHLDATTRTSDLAHAAIVRVAVESAGVPGKAGPLPRGARDPGNRREGKHHYVEARRAEQGAYGRGRRPHAEGICLSIGWFRRSLICLSNLDPSSPLVKLRNQEVDLHRQLAQASVNFQPTYPKVEELNNELKAVQADIKIEVARLAAKFQKDYMTALEREKLLRASLENQKTAENRLNESAIEYSLLKRDVETNRQLYEGLLQKLKEAGVMTGLRSSNVRIVDPASAPTAPSTPNIPRNLLMSLLVGLAGGVSLAFILESRDNTCALVGTGADDHSSAVAGGHSARIPCQPIAASDKTRCADRRLHRLGFASEIADRRGLPGVADLHPAFQTGQVSQGADGHQRPTARG